MGHTGWIAWLRRRDPGLTGVRRAARVTAVACTGFYSCQYLLHNPVMALYAMFGAIALGVLSRVPGPPAASARILLATLPFGYLLVTAGTLLAVRNWAAALGMFVLGFAVTYAGVGGPRLVGLANGMQLLYILPCFPPFAPGTLPDRLAGVTVAVVLLALAHLVLWPDPAPPPYRLRLADAARSLGACITAASVLAARPDRPPPVPLAEAASAAEAIRPSHLPEAERPTSAARRERALSHGGATLRFTLGRTEDLITRQQAAPGTSADPDMARLLQTAARAAQASADSLRGDGPPPDLAPIGVALHRFQIARRRHPADGVHPDRIRAGSLALSVARGAEVLATAARIAAGAAPPPDRTAPAAQPGLFWYAYRPAAELWWRRFQANLTPRSVQFQGALRLAVALAVARLIAGDLNVSHGFWVLLVTLTVLRSRASDTATGLHPVLTGTLAGALLAGTLLALVHEPLVYVVALPAVMLVAFAAAQVLGVFWGQCLFTVLIAVVFAQVAAAGPELAGARVLDVLIGAVVGGVVGLCAWPRGATGELHRAVAGFYTAAATTVRETSAVLTGRGGPGAALPRARHAMMLADSSYAVYQTERAGSRSPAIDWQAALVAGDHAVRGAESLLATCPAGRLLSCADWVTGDADRVAAGFEEFAADLRTDRPIGAQAPAVGGDRWPAEGWPSGGWPAELGADLYQLSDLRMWLTSLGDDLARLTAPAPAPPSGSRPHGTGS